MWKRRRPNCERNWIYQLTVSNVPTNCWNNINWNRNDHRHNVAMKVNVCHRNEPNANQDHVQSLGHAHDPEPHDHDHVPDPDWDGLSVRLIIVVTDLVLVDPSRIPGLPFGLRDVHHRDLRHMVIMTRGAMIIIGMAVVENQSTNGVDQLGITVLQDRHHITINRHLQLKLIKHQLKKLRTNPWPLSRYCDC